MVDRKSESYIEQSFSAGGTTAPMLSGMLDKRRNKVEEIFYSEKQFLVYKAKGIVTYELFGGSEIDGNTSLYHQNSLAEIQSLLSDVHYLQKTYSEEATFRFSNAQQRRIDIKVASGLFVALAGSGNRDDHHHIQYSKEILMSAERLLEQSINLESRLRHLSGGFFMFIIFLGLIILALSQTGSAEGQSGLFLALNAGSSAQEISYVSFMTVLLYGTIGGFMSIAINIRKLKLFPGLKPFHLGILRVFIASVSAVMTLWGIESKLFFDFSITYETLPLLKLISFAVGFSEDIITNLVDKLLRQPKRTQ